MLQKISLGGSWNFVFDETDRGMEEKWYIEENLPSKGIRCCELPGCWNFIDIEKYFHYNGTGWYFKTFEGDLDWQGKRVILVFESVHYRCRVWLNGEKVGQHVGGFTPFEIDVNKFINFQRKNYLAVQVNNELSETTLPPIGVDWFNYGGIVREVYIGITDQIYISDVRIDTRIDGIVNVEFDLINEKLSVEKVLYELTIYDMNGNPQATQTGQIKIKDQEIISCQMILKDPQLWDTRNPYLYRVEIIVQTKDKARILDKIEENIGVREIKIKGDRILLNGHPIKIRGMSYHEDYPHFGRTIPKYLIYQDYSLLKNANVNLVRLAHYPHSREEIEVADRLGMMLMEEVPNIFLGSKVMSDQNVLELAKQQLREVVNRDKNHPSVVLWSLAAECETNTEPGRNFIKELAECVRQIDNGRPLIHASNRPLQEKAYDFVDIIGVNCFAGWYTTDPLKVYGEIMDEVHKKFPAKPIVLSSHGAGAIYGNRTLKNIRWSENYQARLLWQIGEILLTRDYTSGEIIFSFMDFRVTCWENLELRFQGRTFETSNYLLRPGEYNHKGLVDRYRRPKMSYYVVKDLYKRWQKKEAQANKYKK